MNKTLVYVLAVLSVGLSDNAFSAEASGQESIKYKDNGGYETSRHTEQNSQNGSRTSDARVNVDVDSKGLVTKNVDTKFVDDPKGMMNKTTDATTTKRKEKARGGFEEKTSHEFTDAAGADVKEKAHTDVDVDKNGNVSEDTTAEKTISPKGLLNKKTTSTTHVKAVNGQIMEETKENK